MKIVVTAHCNRKMVYPCIRRMTMKYLHAVDKDGEELLYELTPEEFNNFYHTLLPALYRLGVRPTVSLTGYHLGNGNNLGYYQFLRPCGDNAINGLYELEK